MIVATSLCAVEVLTLFLLMAQKCQEAKRYVQVSEEKLCLLQYFYSKLCTEERNNPKLRLFVVFQLYKYLTFKNPSFL